MVPEVAGSNPVFHPFNTQLIYNELVRIHKEGVASAEASEPPLCPYDFLHTLEENEQLKPFVLGTLNDCGGDLSKRWYIGFWVWDGLQQKKIRKRLYEVNNYKTDAERRAFANHYLKGLNKRLKVGMHINNLKHIEKSTPKIISLRINDALDYVLEIIEASLRHSTYLSYKSDVKILKTFLEKNNFESIIITQFDKAKVYLFIDYLQITRKVNNVTINNKIAALKSIFSKLEERDIIPVNPFRKIKKIKEELTNKNLAYTKDQIKELKTTIQEKEPYLWFFIQFIYYTYIRPAEILKLKVGNIDFKKGLITIPANISKNKNFGVLNIPKPLIAEINQHKINTFSKELFLFSAACCPGQKPLSKNYMASRHKKIIDSESLENNYTLYSWKHTGVVNAYKVGIDIKSIQLQCRHSSIEQTDRYLKSLGFQENTAILKIPEI